MKIPAESDPAAGVPVDGYCSVEPLSSSSSSSSGGGSSNGVAAVVGIPQQPQIDSPTLDGDFAEYMWMENEEEFDKQVMQQLEEEALMEQCIEAMLEDERIQGGGGGGGGGGAEGAAGGPPAAPSPRNGHNHYGRRHLPPPPPTQTVPPSHSHTRQPWSDGPMSGAATAVDICSGLQSLRVLDQDELAKQSTLNPDAEEFVPQRVGTVEKAA